MRPCKAGRLYGRYRTIIRASRLTLCITILLSLQACSSPTTPIAQEGPRAITVAVMMDGASSRVHTTARNVEGLLRETGLALGPRDTIHPDLGAALGPGSVIQIIRRFESTRAVQVDVPFETIRRTDSDLLAGEVRELQPGRTGKKEVIEKQLWEDGAFLGVENVEERVVEEPVDRILLVGTGGIVSRGGHDYRYRHVLNMQATGYTAGKESNPGGNGYTYTGVRATRGIVAVDPRVIPLNTRLFIEGYGTAVAADIGGAIKGAKIDLCFETVAEALEWGVRPVRVYILD